MKSASPELPSWFASLPPDVLSELAPAELEELDRLTEGPVWAPLQGPQKAALEHPADELFYGGAAGGGKSDLLIGLGLTAHRKTLLLRRQATQLPELTERVKLLALPRGGHWSGSGHGGTMRFDDRLVEMAGCDHEDDKNKYKGRAHDLKAFDELPDFSEAQYDFICAWNRTAIAGQRCRKVSAGNPPTTSDGEWVIRRWAPWLDDGHPSHDRALPGDLRWYARVDGKEVPRPDGKPFVFKGETITPWSRSFIPARLADNPILLATGYGRTLDALPEPLRSQLLKGDFAASRTDDPWQVIPSAWVKAAMGRWSPDREGDEHHRHLSSVGVDVARGGKDATVIVRRYRNWFAALEKYPGTQTPDGPAVADLVWASMIRGRESDTAAPVNIDVVGVGAAAYDACRAIGLQCAPVNFGSEAMGRDRSGSLEFANLRAYAYWKFREALDPQTGDEIELPDDRELLADLTAPKWSVRTGRILIESKEDIVKRIGRSPDSADAVVIAYLNVGVGTGALPIVFGQRAGYGGPGR